MNAPARIIDTPERARLTVEDFLLLIENGALDAYGKSELIDGDIYVMNAQFSPHARAKSNVLVALALGLRQLHTDFEAWAEVAVHVAPDSMPEPDIIVTNWRGRKAVPANAVALVIEVSETTRRIDLGRKAELYATAGIPEYWVFDLNLRRVCVHLNPVSGGYGAITNVPFGASLEAVAVAALSLDTTFLVD